MNPLSEALLKNLESLTPAPTVAPVPPPPAAPRPAHRELLSTDFTWTNGVGVADISDIRCFLTNGVFGSLVVKSARTGHCRVFTYVKAVHDNENDLLYYIYSNTFEGKTLTIRLFND